MMAELGLEQLEPTTIWQDNQAAIQIAMNIGKEIKSNGSQSVDVTQQGGRHEVCADLPKDVRDDRGHWYQSAGPQAFLLPAG